MISLSAVDLVLQQAAGRVGAQEVPAGTNGGAYVERLQRLCGGKKGDPWCAGEVSSVGHVALGTRWPLPLTMSCQTLYEWGKKKGIVQLSPQRGDVFLVWHPTLMRFAHTGFVVDLTSEKSRIDSHSGNTTLPGGTGDPREGWVVAQKPWAIKLEDRFLRWTLLLES